MPEVISEPSRSAGPEGADYVAVCAPAFAPDLAHRDGERPDGTLGHQAGNAGPLLRHSDD